MKKIFLIFLATLSLTSFAQTGTKNFIDQNYIEVTGKAEMEITPNKIYLEIRINEKEIKDKRSIDEVEKSMIDKLLEIGIDISKQLTIKDMTSNFRHYWLKGSSINLVKEYQLVVESAKTVGEVYQELEALGISNVSIGKIEHSDIQKFKREVKINAIKAAKEKAKSLTNAIGQKIGKAIFIQELKNNLLEGQVVGLSNIVIRGGGYSKKLKQEQKPEIEFEKIKLEYSILVRFEIIE